MKIYHTETQADYDALMVELEAKGCKWSFGREPRELSEVNNWHISEHLTCLRVYDSKVNHASLNYYKEEYPDITITKYKAKVDEKMRFTKENVYKLFSQYRKDGISLNDLQDEILKLDDKPEKVVVPKFVDEFYEGCKDANLYFLTTQLESEDFQSDLGKWYRDCEGRHISGRANAQEVIAKMKLYGYEVEKEPLYYIPLPHLETSDGIQQVLSQRKGDKNYFASRPASALQQRYTKEELEQVPEIYKYYATLIEEENE